MEELSLPSELRTSVSLLTSHLLDPQALLHALSCKSSTLKQLEFERNQFLAQTQASLHLLPTQISCLSAQIHTAKLQLVEESERNGKLQETASGLTVNPVTALKELKRLRKLRAAKETAVVRLREELRACAQRQTGVRLIIEPEGLPMQDLGTEVASVQASNKALRHQIARIERKTVRIGHRIDRLRRLQATPQPAKAQETPMTPLSQGDTVAPSSPPLPMELKVCPDPVPGDVVALFRMPQSRKQVRMDKYTAVQDPKHPFYLPVPVYPATAQFLEFKKDLQMALMLYRSETECPKEHVDIVVSSYAKIEEKEAGMELLITALSGASKAFSPSDARFLLISVLSPSPDGAALWTLAKYGVSDFYKHRKWEGSKQQWSSEPCNTPTLQQLWIHTAASLLFRLGHTAPLRKLAKLLCVHHNVPSLQLLQSLIDSKHIQVLAETEKCTDDTCCGAIITPQWDLRDRVWTLKRATELRGTTFLHTFLNRHMGPIFAATLPGTEARLFYFRAIGLALRCMQNDQAWSSVRAHLIEVLKTITPSRRWQGQSVFTAEEVATAAEILARA